MLLLAPAVAKPSDFPTFGSHLTFHIAFSVSEWVATQLLVSIDQTLTLPSKDLTAFFSSSPLTKEVWRGAHPLRRYSPVLLQESDRIQAE
jgi:hypothetical protein